MKNMKKFKKKTMVFSKTFNIRGIKTLAKNRNQQIIFSIFVKGLEKFSYPECVIRLQKSNKNKKPKLGSCFAAVEDV